MNPFQSRKSSVLKKRFIELLFIYSTASRDIQRTEEAIYEIAIITKSITIRGMTLDLERIFKTTQEKIVEILSKDDTNFKWTDISNEIRKRFNTLYLGNFEDVIFQLRVLLIGNNSQKKSISKLQIYKVISKIYDDRNPYGYYNKNVDYRSFVWQMTIYIEMINFLIDKIAERDGRTGDLLRLDTNIHIVYPIAYNILTSHI